MDMSHNAHHGQMDHSQHMAPQDMVTDESTTTEHTMSMGGMKVLFI